jgi:glutamine amidotransferase
VCGLQVFDAAVSRFPTGGIVPHMGWNSVGQTQGALFEGIGPDADFYFVHSFAAAICDDTVAQSEYLKPFSAALQKENFYAVQFHPEKSGKAGAQLLNNFLKL